MFVCNRMFVSGVWFVRVCQILCCWVACSFMSPVVSYLLSKTSGSGFWPFGGMGVM